MLERLQIQNFTVFAKAEFNFSPGLNIIIGTNGSGKSHVLKLGYMVSRTGAVMVGDELLVYDIHNWQNQLAIGLKEVFQPEELGKLVRRGAKKSSAEVQVDFHKGVDANSPSARVSFTFTASAKQPVVSGKQPVNVLRFPAESELEAIELSSPVFIPPKEVLTMSWMLAQHELRKIPLDITYPQLLRLLNQAPLRKIVPAATKALTGIEALLGGR
ncbi:MAG TPA: AAA family ATPase, partial [Hymenobacter sp.]|nr:AAA family ATPase [Hymenobacter sp.]